MKDYVQIAGALDFEDAINIIQAGADEIGIPVGPDLHTPELTDEKACELIRKIGKRICVVAITYLIKASEVCRLLEKLNVKRVQLHGDIPVSEVEKLTGQVYIVKSFSIGGVPEERLAEEIIRFEPFVNAFLLDTFDKISGARGATGKTHDWNVSKQLIRKTRRPVILAGGLNADNVSIAIKEVGPAGVDAHTRLENSQGRKDLQKLALFVEHAKNAFASRRYLRVKEST